jgi:hypothetical protein
MVTARQARGRKTAKILAAYWRRWWPHATALEGSSPGVDIMHMDGLAPEVKATSGVPLLAALRQAHANAGDRLAFVVWRPDGYGIARTPDWVMAFTVEDGTDLLLRAGYGGPPTDQMGALLCFIDDGRGNGAWL